VKCKYPPCPNAVPEKTGKREREYCCNAHRQADYRRRHRVVPATELEQLHRQLAEARSRVALLGVPVSKTGKTYVKV
jgi:hypothetical protein